MLNKIKDLGKYIKCPQDYPEGPFYLLIIYSEIKIHHEGDERSRTNPGHGYPAYTETINSFESFAFKTEENVKIFLNSLSKEDILNSSLLYCQNKLNIVTNIDFK